MSHLPTSGRDLRAVVRAADALTTQVRRIANALQTPVVEYEVAEADAPTTPATTCSAQHHHFDPIRECIRAAQHHGDHIDEHGFHWSDTVAVYPIASAMVREAPAADEDQALRWARRESLLVLLTRLQRGRPVTAIEAATLRQHVETEMREADTARAEAQRQERIGLSAVRAAKELLARRTTTLRQRAERAEAAIERVRHLAGLIEAGAPWTANHQTTATRLRAALDGTEQPTTEA